jgi:hypothetical protein
MQDKEADKRIKFDATINLGHVLTFFGFIATGASMWQSVDKRLVVLEQARTVQTETDHRHDAERAEIKKTMREDLREINSKLDRLMEKK